MTARHGAIRLPVVPLGVAGQRYSCHGCGNCCRDFTVQLREADLAKLSRQKWEERLGGPVTVEFRGRTFLRQREDGACVFLQTDGLCRIHAEFGLEEKPIACQMFPFSVTPGPADAAIGLSFACGSVAASRGAELFTHRRDVLRMLESLPETLDPAHIDLAPGLEAEAGEVEVAVERIDRWLARAEIPLRIRLDGFAWLAQSLQAARLDRVRGERFVELVATLAGALPDELALLPVDGPSRGQRRLLRQAVFARVEDPKIGRMVARGRFRSVLDQLLRSRRFAAGRGAAPALGPEWPAGLRLEGAETVAPVGDSVELAAIDDLVTRWMRGAIRGRRRWGAGHYAFPLTLGLVALAVDLAAVGWLARLRASARDDGVRLEDVVAAVGRIDRTSGRAPWLGSRPERLRLGWLALDDGLRRTVRWSW
jgi:lysine-N-methylase